MSETPKPGTPKPETPKPKVFDSIMSEIQKESKPGCCEIVITGALYLSMIIVGAINYSNRIYSYAALYLILTGVMGILFLTLQSKFQHPKIVILFIILFFIILIWGSVTVFGKLEKVRCIL